MEVQFVEFYPHHKFKNGFSGHAHVYLPELGVDLRGIMVGYDTRAKKYNIKLAGSSPPSALDTNVKVKITYFSIRDVVERKLFYRALEKACVDGLAKKYGTVDGKLDWSKMVFLMDNARESEWMKRKFEYLKNQLDKLHVPTDGKSKNQVAYEANRKPFVKRSSYDDRKPYVNPNSNMQIGFGGKVAEQGRYRSITNGRPSTGDFRDDFRR